MPGLRAYAEAVLSWNRNVSNLISDKDEARFVERHLLESLAGVTLANSQGVGRWIDLGSGAGLPAIPLILCGVGRDWTLVEARRTKALFLTKFAKDSGLHGVEVACARFETWVGEGGVQGQFDGMTSRATLKAMPTIELAMKVLMPGGRLLLWKGSSWADELGLTDDERTGWRLVESRRLPNSSCVVLEIVVGEAT